MMKNLNRYSIMILVILSLWAVFPCPCQADDPDTVNLKFQEFVQEWVAKLQSSYLYTRDKPELVEAKNQYIARYYHLDETSIKTEVKKSDNSNQVYTGVLQYNEFLFQSTGTTRQLAETGKFKAGSMRQMTEIFLYEKGSWVR